MEKLSRVKQSSILGPLLSYKKYFFVNSSPGSYIMTQMKCHLFKPYFFISEEEKNNQEKKSINRSKKRATTKL